MKNNKKWYVGEKAYSKNVAFQSETTPTERSHGILYNAVIGPFVTKRGAMWAEKYGRGNPHFTCVADAERIAKSQENDNRLAKEAEEDILTNAK